MGLVDEEGRLFGVINVIDLMALTLVIALLFGAFTFLTGGGGEEEPTRYVTVSLSENQSSIVERIRPGPSTIGHVDGNITAVYAGPSPDDGTVVLIRLATQGLPTNNGRNVRVGERVFLSADRYRFRVRVLGFGENKSLPVHQETVQLVTTAEPAVAGLIDEGDQRMVAGRRLLRVQSVESRTRLDESRARVVYQAQVLAVQDGERSRYGGYTLKPGVQIPFETNEYRVNGTVVGLPG
jgi:hypothetical protein